MYDEYLSLFRQPIVTFSSSVLALRGQENIRAVCLINFSHCSGKFVSTHCIEGGVILANSIVTICAYKSKFLD